MLNYAAGNPVTGYNLTRSLRFRASASAYLSRTPASAGNRQIWTYSDWIKRGQLGSLQSLLSAGTTGPITSIYFSTSDQLVFYTTDSFVSTSESQTTNAVFRDPAAYYHVLVSVDTTQATYANRVKIYINGVQQTVTVSNQNTQITQNAQLGVNRTEAHNIGRQPYSATQYFDGYMTEVNFIDGQALTPSSFGSTNSTTGVWQPAKYTGTYGTNGFYLPFTDNSALTTSSNVGLGKDFSGNGNYWVTNNISITSGVTYDSMTDVPTLTSATAANFAVLNPLDKGASNTLSNGNLQYQGNAANATCVKGTFAMPSTGKWYWEATKVASIALVAGVATRAASLNNYLGSDAFGWGYSSGDGLVYNNGTTIRAGATLTTGDILGVAFDSGAGSLSFYKNNVFQATAITGFTPATIDYFMAASTDSVGSGGGIFNFGQRPFAYTPPSGFVALNTYNLPDSTIKQGNKVMDATLYTGNLTGQTITNTAGFKPDLVWAKSRSAATDNKLVDSVRGATLALVSNSTAAETTDLTGIVSFNSNGFTLGTSTTYNNLAATYVGWQWQAGQGSSSSNTSGTITSTVSVNASAGFSVVTYTGTGANATVGHGLGVAPTFMIVKNRSVAYDWRVYHSSINNTSFLNLSTTDAAAASATTWNNTSPTSSVFSIGTAINVNNSGSAFVAYCWAEIAGYSKFGSYSGNGSDNGPFIYCGFLPKWVLIKSQGVDVWMLHDTGRNTYNTMTSDLYPNLSSAEDQSWFVDALSNGFKIRSGGSTAMNSNGVPYVYMAFAENPFKNSLAR